MDNRNNLSNLKVVLKRLNPEKIVPLRGGVGFALTGINTTCCSLKTVDREHAKFVSFPRRSLRIAIAESCYLDFRAKPKLALKRLGKKKHPFSKPGKYRKQVGLVINEKLASRTTDAISEQGTTSVGGDAHHTGAIVCTGIFDRSLCLQTYSSAPITTLSAATSGCTFYQGNTSTSPTGSTSFPKVSSNLLQGKDNTTWTKKTTTASLTTEPIHTETETMSCPTNLEMTSSGVYQGIRSTTENSKSIAALPACTMSRPTEALDLILPYHILYQGTCVNTTVPSYKLVLYPHLSMGQSVGLSSPSDVYRTEMPVHTVQSINTGARVGGGEMGACAASENVLHQQFHPHEAPKVVSSKRRTVPIILARSRKLKTPVSSTVPNQSVSFSSVTATTPLLQPVIPVLSSPVHVTQGSQLGGIVGMPMSLYTRRSVPLSTYQEQSQTAPVVTVLGEHDIRQALTSTVQSDSPSVCNFSPQQIHRHQQSHCTVPNVTGMREQSTANCLSSRVLSHTPSVDSIATALFHSPVTCNVNSSVARQPWWQQHAMPSRLVEPSVVLSYHPSVYSVSTTLSHSPSGYNVNQKHVWQQQQQQQQRVPALSDHLTMTQTPTRTLLSHTPSMYSLHSTLMHSPSLSNINSNVTGQQPQQQHSAPSSAVLGAQSIRQSPLSTVLANSPSICSVGTTLLHSPLVSNANINIARQQWPQQAAPPVPVLGPQSIRQAHKNAMLSSNRSAYSANTVLSHSPSLPNVKNSVARQQQQQWQPNQNTGNSGQGNTRPPFTNMSLSDSRFPSSTGTSPLQMLLHSYDKLFLTRQQQQQQQSMQSTVGFERQRTGHAVTSTVFSDSLSLCSVGSTTPLPSYNVKGSDSRKQWQQHQPPRPSMVFSRYQSTGQAPTNTVFSYKHSVCSVATTPLNSLTVTNISSSVARWQQHKDSSRPATVVSMEQSTGRHAVLGTVSPGSVGTPLNRSSLVSSVNSSVPREQQQQSSPTTAVSMQQGTRGGAVLGTVFTGSVGAPLTRSSLASSVSSFVSKQQQHQSSPTPAVLIEQGTWAQALLDSVSTSQLCPLSVSTSNSCAVRLEQAAASTSVARVQSAKPALASTPSSENSSVSSVNNTPCMQSVSDLICVSSTKASYVSQTQQPPTIPAHLYSGVNNSDGHGCSPERALESLTSISAAGIEETFSISSLLPELTPDQDGSDESPCCYSFQNDDSFSREISRTGAAANDAVGGEPQPPVSAPTSGILKTTPLPSTSSAFDTSRVGKATDRNLMTVTSKQDKPVIVVSSCHAKRSLEDSLILQQNPTANCHPDRELIPPSGKVRSLLETGAGLRERPLTSCGSEATSAASIKPIMTTAGVLSTHGHGLHTVRGQHLHLTWRDSGKEAISFVDLTDDNPEVTERNTATVSSVHATRDESLVAPSEESSEFTANAPFLSPSSKDLRLGPGSSRQELSTENKKDHATVPVTRLGEGNSDGGNNSARISALVDSPQREDSELATFHCPLSRMSQNLVDKRLSQPGERNDREKEETQLRVPTIDEICAKLETILTCVSSKKGTDFRWLVEDVKQSLQKEPAINTSDVLSSLSKVLQIKRSELESKRAQLHESSEALRMLIINCKSELLCQGNNYSATMAEKRKTDFQIGSLSKRTRTDGLTMERWCTMMQEFNHRKEALNKERNMLKKKWSYITDSS